MLNELLQEISHIIYKASPLVAKALLSPYANIVLGIIFNTFGIKIDDVNQLISKISSDVPAAISNIKTIEENHGDILREILKINFPLEAEISLKLKWQSSN